MTASLPQRAPSESSLLTRTTARSPSPSASSRRSRTAQKSSSPSTSTATATSTRSRRPKTTTRSPGTKTTAPRTRRRPRPAAGRRGTSGPRSLRRAAGRARQVLPQQHQLQRRHLPGAERHGLRRPRPARRHHHPRGRGRLGVGPGDRHGDVRRHRLVGHEHGDGLFRALLRVGGRLRPHLRGGGDVRRGRGVLGRVRGGDHEVHVPRLRPLRPGPRRLGRVGRDGHEPHVRVGRRLRPGPRRPGPPWTPSPCASASGATRSATRLSRGRSKGVTKP